MILMGLYLIYRPVQVPVDDSEFIFLNSAEPAPPTACDYNFDAVASSILNTIQKTHDLEDLNAVQSAELEREMANTIQMVQPLVDNVLDTVVRRDTTQLANWSIGGSSVGLLRVITTYKVEGDEWVPIKKERKFIDVKK